MLTLYGVTQWKAQTEAVRGDGTVVDNDNLKSKMEQHTKKDLSSPSDSCTV
jgi:aspartate oxidase